MSIQYWISQALVVIAYIILGIGIRKKERMTLLLSSSLYQLLMVIHYSLLLGLMGVIAGVIALLRNIIFIYNEKRNKSNPTWILIAFSLISIALTFIFYKSPADILPCILTLVGIYSYWCTNTKVTRIGNLIISGCYIVYAIPLKSWFLMICEIFVIINTIRGYLEYERNKK